MGWRRGVGFDSHCNKIFQFPQEMASTSSSSANLSVEQVKKIGKEISAAETAGKLEVS